MSYLLGSVPAGYLVGRAHGIDLRTVGSGNVGATNTVRALGKRWGIAVFLFDFIKGFVPAYVGLAASSAWTPWSADATALTFGIAAVLGHVFPVWLRFKGGKGVATSGGMCAGLCPPAAIGTLIIWVLALKISKYVSVASMVAAGAFPALFVLSVGPEVAFGDRRLVTLLSIVLAVLIFWLHRANIGRLRRGEEHRVGAANGKDAQKTGTTGTTGTEGETG